MENSAEKYFTLKDVIRNIKGFLFFLLKKWYFLLIAGLLGACIGWFLFSMQKPKYEAECTFILEEKQSSLGGLSGIASQFGLDIGGMAGGGGMFSGDNILEILSSKTILQGILLSKVDSSAKNTRLADLYLDFSGLKSKRKDDQRLSSITFENIKNHDDLGVLQDSVLNIIFNNVVEKNLSIERISKKSTIISVKVFSESPDFSKLLVKRLVIGSRDFYLNVKTSVTNANVARLDRKADSLLHLLTRKTYQVAQVQINDPNPAIRALQVPTEIATRDKSILATLYTEVVKNLEISKTSQMMQTPVVEILDEPSLSIYDNKKGKLFYIVISVFVVIVTCSIFLFFSFMKIT